MRLIYDQRGDSAAVLVAGEIGPDDTADVQQLDADRIVRYDAHGRPIEYQFLDAKASGVKLDDLEHRDELARLFKEAGFTERTWSTPLGPKIVHRRRRQAAG